MPDNSQAQFMTGQEATMVLLASIIVPEPVTPKGYENCPLGWQQRR